MQTSPVAAGSLASTDARVATGAGLGGEVSAGERLVGEGEFMDSMVVWILRGIEKYRD